MTQQMNREIYTIGHSTRSFEDFLNLLKQNEIKVLVDVRSLPGSNKFPHFNQDILSESLHDKGIEYIYLKDLGGRRKTNKDSSNTAWINKSFQAYADYMETDDYQKGLDKLTSIALKSGTAIMCTEAVWWRCHRSMVADSLKVKGWRVMHIVSKAELKEHSYTSPARIVDNEVFYHEE